MVCAQVWAIRALIQGRVLGQIAPSGLGVACIGAMGGGRCCWAGGGPSATFGSPAVGCPGGGAAEAIGACTDTETLEESFNILVSNTHRNTYISLSFLCPSTVLDDFCVRLVWPMQAQADVRTSTHLPHLGLQVLWWRLQWGLRR